jgi:hypothetical protein
MMSVKSSFALNIQRLNIIFFCFGFELFFCKENMSGISHVTCRPLRIYLFFLLHTAHYVS